MLIKRVSLRNIKSYEEATIQFQPGINFVCGENGAGKTTIIEAIGYCLFGHQPYNLGAFLRNGRGKGSIEVVFTARDGCDYQVTREFDANKAKSPRVSDGAGNVIDLHGNADYDAWFRATAGLDPDMAPKHLFEQVLGVSQGTFAAPFLQSAGVRRQVFDALFRVNSFRTAHDRALPGVNALRDRIVALEKEDALIAQRLEPVPALERELTELRGNAAAVEADLASTRAALAVNEREAAELKRLADEAAAAEKQLIALERETAAALDRQTRLSQEIARCREAHEKVEAARAGHELYLALAAELAACEARVNQLLTAERALQSAEKQLADLTARCEQGEAAYRQRDGELALQRDDLAARTAAAEREQAAAEARLVALDRPRAGLKAASAAKDALGQVVRAIGVAAGQAAAAVERIGALEERASELAGRLAARERLSALAATLPAREEALRAAQGELARLRERRELLRQNRETAVNGRCPFLDVECAAIADGLGARFEALIADLEARERTAEARVAAAADELGEAVAAGRELAALETAAAEFSRLSDERAQLSKDIAAAAAGVAKAAGPLTALADALAAAAASWSAWTGADGSEGDGQDSAAGLLAAAAACRRAADSSAAIGRAARDDAALAEELRRAQSELESAERRAADALAAVNEALVRAAGEAAGAARGAATAVAELRLQREALARAEAALAAQRAELDALEKRRTAAAAQCDELRRRIAAQGDPRGEAARLRERQASHAPAHEAFIRHQPDAERLPGLLNEAEVAAGSLAALQRERTAVSERLNLLRQQFDPARLARVEQELRAQHARAAGLAQQLTDLRAREHSLVKQLSELAELRAQRARVADELARHRTALNLLEAARQVLNSAGEPVAEHFRRQVAADADRIQRKVSGDAAALVWDRDYEVTLVDAAGSAQRRRVFAQLSGGEQMTVALALRIALLRFLSPIRIGFFDEPTVNLDAGRRSNLASMLRSLAGEVGQLFLISHDDTFDSITENVTYLQKTAGGTVVREEAVR